MANVHDLFSNKKDDSDDEKDESNNRYVGGIGDHGGGRWVSRFFVRAIIVPGETVGEFVFGPRGREICS